METLQPLQELQFLENTNEKYINIKNDVNEYIHIYVTIQPYEIVQNLRIIPSHLWSSFSRFRHVEDASSPVNNILLLTILNPQYEVTTVCIRMKKHVLLVWYQTQRSTLKNKEIANFLIFNQLERCLKPW